MGEWINISVPDGAFKAYVARPAGTPKAAVIAIQEIFGVNAVMRGKADWLAREGFLAVSPDLFWRIEPGVDITDQSEVEWNKAFSLMNAFDAQKGVGDIQATITQVRSLVGGGKVGAIGYCLGGLLAYLTACNTDCDASVGYYGVNIDKMLDQAARLSKPLMLHIAGKDGFVKPDAQAAMHAGLDSNPLVTLHDYAEQDHAFTREGGQHYDAAAAKIADERTIGFLKKHLA
ncbi:MAG: dienelactone hydrolase family protein [Alphaproteobacteria bacterium]|nr:dienelactone hydrolase family protein [Alphaproteobacteria bacterium]